jgi:tetratricopeptide (TPR) repeat protein
MARSILLLAGVALLSWAGALAAPPSPPSGGGGPSGSTPSYDPAAEYRKGVEALQAKQYKDARRAFDHVLDVAPTNAAANFLAGMSAAGLEDFKAARKYYERAVKADKEMIDAHRELGITYLKLGDRAKAEEELAKLKAMQEQCSASCPKSADIATAITALSAALAGPTQASLETRPSLIFTSTEAGDRAYLEAVGLINDGRYEEAIASLEASLKTFGPHPDILTYLGFTNRKLHRFDVAESYYRAALAAAPGHRAATEYYGELMVERGDTKGAKVMLARLEESCTFGCAEADELRRWIEGRPPAAR